jgi:hypothetical protein
MADIGERCSDIAKRRGVNLFEQLLHYVTGDEKALGYEGMRTRFMKGGEVVVEPWITPEMRFAATKEAIKYVAPQLSAVAITELNSMGQGDEDFEETRPATRQEIIDAIKNDPFFQVQAKEIIDVTPELDPFKGVTDEPAGPTDPAQGTD